MKRVRDEEQRLRLPVGAAVIALDGTRWRVLGTGELEQILPPGYPKPGCSHATARRP